MRLSKRKKVCIAVLGLALGALVVDRALVGFGGNSPAETIAAQTRTIAKPAPKRYLALTSTTPPPAPKQTLSERLAELSRTYELDPDDVRDAFTPSQAWVKECSSARDFDTHPTAASTFIKRHELKAVVLGGAGGADIAIVDDRCMLVGEELDGFTLISIGERSVIFESDGSRVILELKDGT